MSSELATPFGKPSLLSRLGLDTVVAEIRSNRRARFGLFAVGAVLLSAGALRIAAHVSERNSEIVALESKARELHELIGPSSAQWKAAQRRVSALAAESRAMLWSNEPVGIAQADFLNWIQQATVQSGMPNANIRIGEVRHVGENSNLVEIRVNIYAGIDSGVPVTREGAFDFLRTISTDKRLVLTRNLHLRFAQPMMLEAEVATFVKEAPTSRAP